MKKTYSYFIIHRYEKGVSFKMKLATALLLAASAQFSVDASPKNQNNHFIKSVAFTKKAADVRITGTVTDATGVTLPGASISIKGGRGVAVADVNGHFTASVPDNAILTISYTGYVSQDVSVAGKTDLKIVLQAAQNNLNDVVVIGYTTQRKKDLTGAVSLINSKDIASLPVGGVDQVLQGKAAGVSVSQNTGAPGGGISVRVRGVGTINNNDPLYIIDGVPTQTGINQISPDDIESINILKDASSAAIYGARASNGVVIVTTKKGKSGKTKLSLSAYTGVQTAQNLIKMANNSQYVTAYNTAAKNDGRPQISDSLARTLSDVNWLKEVLKPAPITNANLSVSGGNENSQYIVSANYFTQDGLIKNSSFDRLNLRTAVNSTLNKYLKIGTNVNLAYSKTRSVGSSGDGYTGAAASVVRFALFRTPGTPVYNAQGQFVDLPKQDPVLGNFLGDGINPVAMADATNNNTYGYTVLGDAFIEVDPIKNLKIKSDIGLNLIQTDYKQFFETYGIDRFFNSPNSLAQSHTNNLNYNWTNTAIYDLIFGKHTINFLAGSEAIKQDVQGLSASRKGYVNQTPNFQYLDNGTSASQQNGGNEYHSALFSLFGRIGYQYDDKYLASVNYRRDGSSQLDPSSRYESFYSGSLGWRIDREDFLKDIKPISTLKLRASIGQLGNSQIGTYPYTSLLSGNFYYPFGGVSTQGYSITSKGNPNIKWEKSTQQDVGLDLGFFDNALLLSADYYIKNTSNVLLNLPLPSSAGNGGNPAVNAGKVRNSGIELELTYRKTVNKDLGFSVTGNLATVKNRVVSLAGAAPIANARIDNNYFATLTQVGQPIGSFYLLQQEGIFQNAQQVFTHAYQGPGIRPGDVMYKDVNGDGVIDDKDRTFVGSPIPKLTYGLTASVNYKNFDLSLFFQGVYGNKIYNQVLTDIEGFYRPFNITERIATNSWTGEGSTNTYPLLSWSDGTNNKQPSTRFLESGSYLRLKNVQLGYKLGANALKSIGLSSVRVFASGQNLLTFTKYTGLDPEQYYNDNNGNAVTAVGIDWGTYPSARTFTIGINANF
ncbi:SusC/RagA family TonB-linked outer membrane protein [Mucilaginibacter sp. KACC 22063]|uniref:SusC/RagA family TonB-linked outer membrane protein n=1 Tax=Mucilaginibacter sp. KACC 22063 TaxID=3025666 RepID=UPI002365EB4F|nr:TonB-dependent receptor [Mucilaginibacter sp. KACC 22063]WDF56701.1 TonB-dependent receptor [Mucilaginibacter sp. KACC 22063]